jgi:hypothetical protein
VSIPTILYVIALVLFIVEELRAKGQSLLAWGAILVAVGLLWGHFG